MNIPTVNNIQIYITALILVVATLTFLFGPGILEKKKLEKREKIMLKNHLKEFVSFWKNESHINDIDSEIKELNKKGNEIRDLEISLLSHNIADKTDNIGNKIIKLSKTLKFNNDESRREFERKGNELVLEVEAFLGELPLALTRGFPLHCFPIGIALSGLNSGNTCRTTSTFYYHRRYMVSI
ncbi:MAG: hypothetical protein MPEBLZ_02137 [Candidatus Methanoperedens nitroreducens]|uniref:Uncharacterized protein n=2 Tax=Candidatus Methanoperedens TaxID=1392997 RepID=A0A0P7ZHT7_9EURY|nr:MAG: hypothetical protein MPEBLZ_02137 [Candidatus Methanoperedens sp. BLZ1]MBZ0174966.1 hypothetical protein [Candidatus Methanoperedens nitroreducens]MCX9078229.1 hypothetical protein [Candidatus Methanoperedens sp.]